MEVLNLGMMRTGTMSMQHALDILGVPCYHGAVMLGRSSDIPLWAEALDAKFYNKGTRYGRREWDRLIGDFGALSDVPAICFAEDLVEAYPEAKVILIDRERDAWFESFDEAVISACWRPSTHIIASIDRWWLGPMRDMTMRWVRGWFKSNSKEEMREKAIPNYEGHYALVRKVTPPERLLEYELGSGWEPLCKFLGKPVPDVPFPTANDRKRLHEMTRLISQKSLVGMGRKLAMLAVPAAVASLAYWIYIKTSRTSNAL